MMFKIFFILNLLLTISISETIPWPCYVLELRSLGIVGPEKRPAERRINDLFVYNNRLYIGQGDAVVNTGPTDVVFYDFTRGKFITEFTVDEEAIYRYQEVDGQLVIPGVKATDTNRFGNLYIRTDTGWIKLQTIPNGVHINSLVSFRDQLFAGVDAFSEVGDGQKLFFGAIYVSSDRGRTWSISNTTQSDDRNIYRIRTIVEYKDKLYAFPYAFSPLKLNQIPDQYHQGLSKKPYKGYYLILTPDIMGKNDVVVYDGNLWQPDDIVDEKGICYILSPFVFYKKLVLPVIFGEYVDYLSLQEWMPIQARLKFFVYNGKKAQPLRFDCDRLFDVVIRDGELYLLIEKDSNYYIAHTENLKRWEYFLISPIVQKPRAIEFYNNKFYIGMEDGNIFESTGYKKIARLKQANEIVPTKIYGSAELPRDGRFYWVAISGWASWAHPAQVLAQVKYGNLLEFYTENLTRLNIFLPRTYLDSQHDIVVIIDSQLVYEGEIGQTKEIICSRVEENGQLFWTVEKGDRTWDEYEYQKIYIARADTELSRDMLGRWKGSVIKEKMKADIAIISRQCVKKGLNRGDIYLEDIYDMNCRNRLCTFRVRGKKLLNMLQYNLNLDISEQIYISGCELEINKIDGKMEIVESSIEPEKEYFVVIEDYLAERARKFFGVEIEFQKTDYDVYDLLLDWLTKNRIIKG